MFGLDTLIPLFRHPLEPANPCWVPYEAGMCHLSSSFLWHPDHVQIRACNPNIEGLVLTSVGRLRMGKLPEATNSHPGSVGNRKPAKGAE